MNYEGWGAGAGRVPLISALPGPLSREGVPVL